MGTGEIDFVTADIRLAEQAGRLVDALEEASRDWSDLSFLSIHSVSPRAGDVDAALDGMFRHHDERFRLSPPIDWWAEPYRGANERGFFQNSFVFADPLLADPRFEEVLPSLAAIFADWLAANPRRAQIHPHRYAWHDHAAAGRVVALSFVLREGVRRRLLDRSASQALSAGVLEHIQYLLAEENYAAHNNHGFASDAAVAIAARSLAPAPPTASWAEIAGRRFSAVLDHMIDRREAIHLEHSPYYHWIIQGALERFAASDLFEHLDLPGLTRRMREAGAWLVAPDGTLPPLGDTPMGQRPPRSALASHRHQSHRGMKVFPASGYAVVRADGSALFVTAAHHPTAHKHADDGSFCLYEHEQPIILDSGNPGYEYESPEFRYGTSPAAHATVCVDDFDWVRQGHPYGSGILASAESDGLCALLVRNPGAVPGGGAARRALLYHPGHFLVVFDDVDAEAGHRLTRNLPLAPGLQATPGDHGGATIWRDREPVARLVQLSIEEAPADALEIVIGQRTPRMRGFFFPTPEQPLASADLSLVGETGKPRALAILLDGRPCSERPSARIETSRSAFEITIAGISESAMSVRVDEDSIALRLSS